MSDRQFEWNAEKADSNLRKHGVSFEEATTVFNARLDADYRLARTVDESVALNALRDAKAIFEMLRVNDG